MTSRDESGSPQTDQGFTGAYLRTVEQLAASADRPERSRRYALGLVALAVTGAVGLASLSHVFTAETSRPRVAAVPAPAPAAREANPAPPRIVAATPRERKLRLRVGEERWFAVDVRGDDLLYRWSVDGSAAGSGETWTYKPGRDQVGRRRIGVEIFGSTGTSTRLWAVRIQRARGPRIVSASPPGDMVDAQVDTPVRFAVATRAGGDGETLRTTWMLDGARVGQGETLNLRPERPGTFRLRAIASGDRGATLTREWRLAVAAPATPPEPSAESLASARVPAVTRTTGQQATAPAAGGTGSEEPAEPVTASAADPARREFSAASSGGAPAATTQPGPATTPAPSAVAGETRLARAERPTTADRMPEAKDRVPAPVDRAPSARQDPKALVSGVSTQEVDRLLERYASAWRRHDVAELQRIGQVTSAAQAKALEDYFERTGEIEVEVRVLEVISDGGRVRVRFTRRDRFRDPIGRLVSKESPPLEKEIARSADGLRFSSPSR